ncbi:hypothetical protein Aperf_G00000038798 [Anoplocephala perfoliata]
MPKWVQHLKSKSNKNKEANPGKEKIEKSHKKTGKEKRSKLFSRKSKHSNTSLPQNTFAPSGETLFITSSQPNNEYVNPEPDQRQNTYLESKEQRNGSVGFAKSTTSNGVTVEVPDKRGEYINSPRGFITIKATSDSESGQSNNEYLNPEPDQQQNGAAESGSTNLGEDHVIRNDYPKFSTEYINDRASLNSDSNLLSSESAFTGPERRLNGSSEYRMAIPPEGFIDTFADHDNMNAKPRFSAEYANSNEVVSGTVSPKLVSDDFEAPDMESAHKKSPSPTSTDSNSSPTIKEPVFDTKRLTSTESESSISERFPSDFEPPNLKNPVPVAEQVALKNNSPLSQTDFGIFKKPSPLPSPVIGDKTHNDREIRPRVSPQLSPVSELKGQQNSEPFAGIPKKETVKTEQDSSTGFNRPQNPIYVPLSAQHIENLPQVMHTSETKKFKAASPKPNVSSTVRSEEEIEIEKPKDYKSLLAFWESLAVSSTYVQGANNANKHSQNVRQNTALTSLMLGGELKSKIGSKENDDVHLKSVLKPKNEFDKVAEPSKLSHSPKRSASPTSESSSSSSSDSGSSDWSNLDSIPPSSSVLASNSVPAKSKDVSEKK